MSANLPENIRCRIFKPGCIHDPELIPFYLFCAEYLRNSGFTADIDVTMGHILAGGIRIQDFVTTDVKMKCRDENLRFEDCLGRVVLKHNKSFEDLGNDGISLVINLMKTGVELKTVSFEFIPTKKFFGF